MASSNVTINVMLAIHAKRTQGTDMYRPLRQYIAMHYGEREAQDCEEDLQTVQQLRTQVTNANDVLEARRDILQKYFRALTVMETRFPISSEREHVNSLVFTWWDAFKQGKKAAQQNIHFEKAAVMFNLGAVQSQLGLAADRSNAAGLKQACNCFQAAAGAFAYLRDNVAMKANPAAATPDVGVECAGMLERLMLAQAQECFFEKVSAEGRAPSLCAKVAKQVGLFYEEAHAALLLPPLSSHFDKSWVAHVQLKAAQFHAESLFRVSVDLHEQEAIDQEIARLKAAAAILADAKKQCKGVVGPLMDVAIKLEAQVARNLERANKENDRVYLMRVPTNESLPAITGTPLVKSGNLEEVLDPKQEKMFVGLVPDSSAKALSKYTEMVDDIIRTQAEKLQQESEVMRVRLREMDLPDCLMALDGHTTLSEALRDDVEAIQVEGGPPSLHQELQHLRDLRRVNEELLAETEALLEKEERDDAQVRAQFGQRLARGAGNLVKQVLFGAKPEPEERPASATLTKNLKDRANGYAANLKQAGESDGRIEKSVKDNEQLMAILNAKPIEAAIPPLAKPIMSVHGNEDQIAAGLRQLMMELEKLGTERAGLEDMLKNMKQKDNILPLVMTTSGSYEELFKREIAKYSGVTENVRRNVEQQQEVMARIKVQHQQFAAAFQLDEYKVAKERIFEQMRRAIAKYREIRDNMNEGTKFYITLQDAILALKQQCSDFVMTRSMQLNEMMEQVQQQISTLDVSDTAKNHPPGPSGYPSMPYGFPPNSGPPSAPPGVRTHSPPPPQQQPSPPPPGSAPLWPAHSSQPPQTPPYPSQQPPYQQHPPYQGSTYHSAPQQPRPGAPGGYTPPPEHYQQQQQQSGHGGYQHPPQYEGPPQSPPQHPYGYAPPPPGGSAPGYGTGYGAPPPGQPQGSAPGGQQGYGGWGGYTPPPNQQPYGGWGGR